MRKIEHHTILILLLLVVVACTDNDEDYGYMPLSYMPTSNEEYGVRWSITDVNDLGQRCFAACGKEARIGIGSTDGYSDFDNIYPWSEMQRVTIAGDVFVRIPKCSVERYIEDGYEYRVVSRNGRYTHPAFIEDGQELDEIYVSAFEGYVADSMLYSIPNVIPASNYTPKEFLAMAQRRGENYSLYDMRTVDLIFTLLAVEYGCRNSSTILGYGIAQYQQPIEREYNYTDVFYSRESAQQVNTFRTKSRQKNKKITVGSNICICQGQQENILTFAKVIAISDSKNETAYTFDGPPIDVTTDCFIGSCGQDTNWCETCSAPLSWHTGRADMHDNYTATMRNPMRYRGIENIVGNVWHYLPDVTFVDHTAYVCTNMKDYSMHKHEPPYYPLQCAFPYNADNGQQVDTKRKNYWVTSLLYDSDYPFVAFGDDFDDNLLSSQAFGAYYYRREGVNIIANGGGFDHEFRCNILTNRAWIYPDKRWFLYGARLIYKPITAL